MNTFTLMNPFTYETAEKYKGKTVVVKVFDCGVTGVYQGELQPVSTGRTKIGNDEIFNECIVSLKVE